MSRAVKASLPARPRMVSFRQSTEACIKLVQISVRSDLCKLHLAYFSFLFVTVAARHLLRPICLPLFPPFFSTLGQLPDNLYLYRRSGLFICPSPLPFGSHKASCSVLSFPFSDLDFRLAFSFISITPPSFLCGISASTTAYHTVSPISCHLRLFFSPISVFDIR